MISLRERGEGVAVIPSIASKALAESTGVITFASAATLVRVRISRLVLSDIRGGSVESGLQSEAIDLRCAASATLIILDRDKVLFALHGIAREGNAHRHTSLVILVTRDGQSVDNSVGQVQQCQMHIVHHVSDIGIIEHDGNGGKSFVQSGSEGQSEGALVKITRVVSGGLENQTLNLVFLVQKQVVAHGQHIISIRAHALGAINVSISGVTYAPSGLAGVPVVIIVSQLTTLKVSQLLLIPGSRKCQILNIFTSSMATAVIRASSTLAGLALVAVEAGTLTGGPVANTSASTFRILVEGSMCIRRINPSKFKGADTIGTVSAVVVETNTPVIVAGANLVNHASSVATAVIVAVSI